MATSYYHDASSFIMHSMSIELPPDYYLTNFTELLTHVYGSYSDLLRHEQRQFYCAFRALSQDAQKLYVRMLSRKGSYFRASKLQHYQEIHEPHRAAIELEASNLIAVNPDCELVSIAVLFNRREWLSILTREGIDTSALKSLSRQELDAFIAVHFADIEAEVLKQLINEDIYHLQYEEVFLTYRLLFFGNLHQDLSEFVLRDLGIYRYPKIPIAADTRLFSSGEQIERHLAYYRQVEDLENVLVSDTDSILLFYSSMPDAGDDDPALKRRVDRVNYALARQLERNNALAEAASIYRAIISPEARERLVRVLAKLGDIDAALTLCRAIIDAPLNEAEKLFARDFAERTAKKHRRHWPVEKKYQPLFETLALPAKQSVELDVASHLSQTGQCYYSENAIFSSFFGLLYWDIIYYPYRGAFTHPFQMRPHDLYEYNFLQTRKNILGDDCLRIASLTEMKQRILENWRAHLNTASPFVYWNALDNACIDKFCDTIPLAHWQCIFLRMWSDLRENRKGFPDLCYFPSAGSYQLIEVKGPGDRLQKHQLRWMAYFDEHNVPHKVINLERL